MIENEKAASYRLPGIDGLRGLSAIAVAFIFHSRIFFAEDDNPLRLIPGLSWFVSNGWLFVDLFFVISGFIFAHCYLDRRGLRSGVTARDFMWARFARLWPLHAVMMIAVVLLTRSEAATTLPNILLSAVGLHLLIDDATEALNGPIWSLSVELVCYAVFLASALVGRRTSLFVAAFCVGLSLFLVADQGEMARLIGRGLGGYFAGVLLYQVKDSLRRVPTNLLGVLACSAFLVDPSGRGVLVISLVAWPALLAIALRVKAMDSSVMRWLGDRSYAIYLCHVPIYYAIQKVAFSFGVGQGASKTVAMLVAWAMVLRFAHLLYEKLERPAQKSLLAWRDQRNRQAGRPWATAP